MNDLLLKSDEQDYNDNWNVSYSIKEFNNDDMSNAKNESCNHIVNIDYDETKETHAKMSDVTELRASLEPNNKLSLFMQQFQELGINNINQLFDERDRILKEVELYGETQEAKLDVRRVEWFLDQYSYYTVIDDLDILDSDINELKNANMKLDKIISALR